jgi:uncharacterized membrane protein
MVMPILITLHLLAAVIWVGGMFFAYQCLRPVAAIQLEPPQRLPLWRGVFDRFFVWVWAAIVLLLVTGHTMIFQFGGMANVGMHVHLMLAGGYLMIALYMYVFFGPYKRLKQAVDAQIWPEGGKNLNKIRQVVAINLTLGIVTIVIAAAGRFGF